MSLNSQKPKGSLLGKLKKTAIAALTAIATISVTSFTQLETVNAVEMSGGQTAVNIANTLLGKAYDTNNRLGPNSFDCSGFVDYIWAHAGIDSQPLNEGWITNNWVSVLDAQQAQHTDGTQAGLASLDANAGDIIMFFSGGTAPANSVHMGIMVTKNVFISAIYGGVQYATLDGVTSYNGQTVYEYAPAGNKYSDLVRIYHVPSDKEITVNLTKISSNTLLTDGNPMYSLANAVYGIYDGTTRLGSITTDVNGQGSWKGKVGVNVSSVRAIEEVAPEGYELNQAPITANIGSDNIATINTSDKPANDPLVINLTKTSNNGITNSASLEGAEFTVNYYGAQYSSTSEIPSVPTRSWVIKTIERNGKYYATLDNAHKVSGDEFYYVEGIVTLPIGTVTVQETKAPEGYTLTNSILNSADSKLNADANGVVLFNITQDTTGSAVLVGGNEYTVLEESITGNFDITKYISKFNTSGLLEVEPNVEFTAILKDAYQGENAAFTSYEEAYTAIKAANGGNVTDTNGTVLLSTQEYSVLTTNEEGYARSGDLAFGTYEVKQTVSGQETKDMEGSFEFVVNKLNQDTQHYTINNSENAYYLRIKKVDSVTNQAITNTSAAFKIRMVKDSQGNDVDKEVSLKVGSKTYTTFRTNSKEVVVGDDSVYANLDDEQGTFTTPLQVAAGTYEITEVETPDGFVKLDTPITVEAKSANVIKVDEDGDATVLAEVVNEQITGTLTIVKSFEEYKADTTLVDKTDFSQIEFELRATEDVISKVNGEVVTKAGEVAEDLNGNLIGKITLDANGTTTITNIPLGEYELVETKAQEGVIIDDTPRTVVFTQTDTTTKVYSVSETYENGTTKVVVSKKSVTGQGELEGAELTITDSEGSVVDAWTSGIEEHSIEGLSIDKTYTLTEVIAPEGYAKASSIDFKVNADGSVTHVEMIDKVVTINKTDGEGNEVEGAKVVVYDEDGNEVDSWSSTNEPHPVSNVEVGKKYTWHEEYSEDIFGYYYAEDYTFTVTDDGMDQHMEMVDSPIRYQIAKVDDKDGSYVEGVTLKLTDITDENNPVEVELPNDGITTGEPFDLDKKLIAEHTYILEESEYVAGVYKATEIQFTVPKYGTSEVTTITMMDETTNTSLRKVDNYGKPVAGAIMQILETTEDEDGNVIPTVDENGNEIVVYEFTTTEDVHGTDISSYVKGDVTYIAREYETPFGFETTEDIVFTVNGKQDVAQVLVAVDVRKTYYVSAKKVDAQDNTKTLKGAEITLFNGDGTVAKDVNGKECVGTTDENGLITWNVEFNDDLGGYYVKETGAPTGYRINNNKHNVELNEDYDFAKDNPVIIVVNDEALPSTGVSAPIVGGGLFVAAAATLIFLKKKKETVSE